jgi:hypothetical protein
VVNISLTVLRHLFTPVNTRHRIQTDPRPVKTAPNASFTQSVERCRRVFHEHFDTQANMSDEEVLHPEVGFAVTLTMDKTFDIACPPWAIVELMLDDELKMKEHKYV